jgi:hypothetical protein
MEKEQQGSFICYNCGQKNYFSKEKYTGKEGKTQSPGVKEASIECKSCREVNVVKIE